MERIPTKIEIVDDGPIFSLPIWCESPATYRAAQLGKAGFQGVSLEEGNDRGDICLPAKHRGNIRKKETEKEAEILTGFDVDEERGDFSMTTGENSATRNSIEGDLFLQENSDNQLVNYSDPIPLFIDEDGYSHSIMISAFCRSGLLEDAKKLASEFEEKYDKYDIVILNVMLSAYCRAGEMENVMSMMKKMDDSAISPDWNTFNILIRYFCKERLYLLAYRTMEDMNRKGHHPEEGLCSSLIYHLGKTGAHSEAFSVYNMLRCSKRTISKALHENILHILIAGRLLKDAYVVVKDNAGFISRPAIKKFSVNFMRSGNVNLINDVMKAMHSSGHKIDQELFDMAISRYIANPEKKELLLQLLKWMAGQGYAVDSSTRNLILKNSHLFGHQRIVESLSKPLVMSKKVKSHKENVR
ncbi:hypothetical protein HAX54_036334 [Datura stramonium]|uniref:Pentatricopeptide repeat-containing protein n=1 Tax=Datura stramonium TaxID=4076 RepID=A0ABS8VGP9_DATST|nr:hypothetical protein [Datura stramonium]